MKRIYTIILILLIMPFTACDEIWYESDGYYTETITTYDEYDVVEYSDSDDTSGGLEIWNDYEKGSFRSFYGTFKLNTWQSTCDDTYASSANLELPNYLYLYDYDDMIDFEISGSDLVWNAPIYSDDSFDFYTTWLDWYGDASVDFPCSCRFYDVGYSDESFECACEPSHTGETCYFMYDVL